MYYNHTFLYVSYICNLIRSSMITAGRPQKFTNITIHLAVPESIQEKYADKLNSKNF